MKELIWETEIDRPEQRMALISAIIYNLAIIFDNVIRRLPLEYFEANLVLVGIGYILIARKSKERFEFITIGVLWILVGAVMEINNKYMVMGIPIVIIGTSAIYFLLMCMIGITAIKRRGEYRNNIFCYICVVFAFLMAAVHIIAFLGFGACMKYFYAPSIFSTIGYAVVEISKLSVMEFMSMLAVILSMVLQKPKVLYVYSDNTRSIH